MHWQRCPGCRDSCNFGRQKRPSCLGISHSNSREVNTYTQQKCYEYDKPVNFSNDLTATAIVHQTELVNLLPEYATSIDVRFTAINLAKRRGTIPKSGISANSVSLHSTIPHGYHQPNSIHQKRWFWSILKTLNRGWLPRGQVGGLVFFIPSPATCRCIQ